MPMSQAFITLANRIIKNGDDDDIDLMIREIVNPLIDVPDRINRFDLIISSIKNIDEYAMYILTTTNDILIVETLLSAMEFTISRGLNACLTLIKNYDVLTYIVTHPYTKFNIAYRMYEPLRMATLNMDIRRLSILITPTPTSCVVNIHTSGTSTMCKSSVELAVMFKYNDILILFDENGLICTNINYSDEVNLYIRNVLSERAKLKLQLISDISDIYVDTKQFDYILTEELFKYTTSIRRMDANAALIGGVKKTTRFC